jgi:hypothetical protein
MILIVNTKQHRYFDTQANGRDIEFTSSSVFQTLLAVEMGKLSGKMSGTFKTRMIWVCLHLPCPIPSLHLSIHILMIILFLQRYERFKAYFGVSFSFPFFFFV